MQILPYHTETLVLPYTLDELKMKLENGVLPEEEVNNSTISFERFQFVGKLNSTFFRIFRRIREPNNYIPLITGRIEGTSTGSLLFLKFSLFKSTQFFLVFWSFISLCLGLFLLLSKHLYFYSALSFFFGIGNYIITQANFNRYLNLHKKEFYEIIN